MQEKLTKKSEFVLSGMQEIIFLAAIFLISLFLRVLLLDKYPQGFHFDEANADYNIYSLLKIGETVKNGPWPVYLNTFGDYRLMGSVYIMLPTIALLGLTEFAVRLPGALIGALTPIALYFLVKKLTNNFIIAIISSVFLTFSFWHITFSRATSEGIFAIFILTITSVVILLLEKKPTLTKGVLLYLLLLISFISYHPVNLFLLIFIPAVTLSFWKLNKKIKKKFLIIITTVYIIYLIFPQGAGFLSGHSIGRFSQVSFIGEVKERLIKQQSQSDQNMPLFLTRLISNKLTNSAYILGRNYLEFFSPNYLLMQGGSPNRYKIPDVGLINIVEVLGIGTLLIFWSRTKKGDKKAFTFFLMWLLLAPLAATITADDQPNVHRSIIMIPAIQFLAAFGIYYAFVTLKNFNNKFKYLFVSLLSLLFIYHFCYFSYQYYFREKYYQLDDRNFVDKDVALYLKKFGDEKQILALKSTEMYILFFQKIDPVVAQHIQVFSDGNERFLNYTFTEKTTCPSRLDVKTIPDYDVYEDHYYCDTPSWWKSTTFTNADGQTPDIKVSERIPKNNL